MARGPDAGTLVERALALAARQSRVAMTVMEATATRWVSATFSGARHELRLSIADDPVARSWLGTLADADLPMRGHLLADCSVVRTQAADGRLDVWVEALTVEER